MIYQLEKIMFFLLRSILYNVEHPDVSSVKNAILEPLLEGTTNVIVSKDC